ncbi:MAG: hypothetical protein RLZZ471_553, partial [Actinomycetota bacterium]
FIPSNSSSPAGFGVLAVSAAAAAEKEEGG